MKLWIAHGDGHYAPVLFSSESDADVFVAKQTGYKKSLVEVDWLVSKKNSYDFFSKGNRNDIKLFDLAEYLYKSDKSKTEDFWCIDQSEIQKFINFAKLELASNFESDAVKIFNMAEKFYYKENLTNKLDFWADCDVVYKNSYIKKAELELYKHKTFSSLKKEFEKVSSNNSNVRTKVKAFIEKAATDNFWNGNMELAVGFRDLAKSLDSHLTESGNL